VKYYLAVEVEHVRYARFLPLDREGNRSMELTTLVDNQRRADINIYLLKEQERVFLHTLTAAPLPEGKAGEPRITLSGKYDGKQTVRMEVRVNGRRFASRDISLRGHIKRRGYLLPALLVLLLALIGAGGWLTLRGCGGAAQQQRRAEEPQVSQAEESAAESSDRTYAAEEESPAETATAAESEAEPETASGTEAEEETTAAAGAEEEAADDSAAAAGAEQETAAGAEDTSAESGEEPAVEEGEEEAGEAQEAPAVLPEETVIYFQPDSANLTVAGREKLSQLLPELRQVPGNRVIIAGHCALYGTEQGRMDLSADRARAVYSYLQQQGWSPNRDPQLQWYGGKQPVTTARDEQQLNRRVEITVEPDN
jgi:outer membrane protein OmpA-like peptidoglycan-associated protein